MKTMFTITNFEASKDEDAWDIVEEGIRTNMSEDWLMTPEEALFLANLIKKKVKL